MEDVLFSSSSLPSTNPDPSSICDDSWAVAEETTHEVLCCIHPTLDSEEKRKDVIDYVQKLIRCCLGCEVFPYGSVPLKTYLPDGDIDLTSLSSPNVEESLARDVLAVLQGEEQNENAEYEVKDTQFIDAEVKLVKCLVQNIVIDISFNQLGGLCTLCFLEQVDRLVGKNHLFKRSIILIKAWCYYESRILGAHHGLISTYALETLVLYIFHLFHSSLNGPIAVLYRFLDYFSKFDWENYCISLNGPVCKSSLPDLVVERPENGQDDLMLSEEFLRNCMDMFSVSSRGPEMNSRAFPQKHLNIIDPLKENNNLGRSVHRGNFYRIRSAFKYGARKLGRILLLPRKRIADEIKKFLSNTLERHGCKYGADIQNFSLVFGAIGPGHLSSSPHSETFSEDVTHTKSLNVDLENDNSEVEDKCTLKLRNELDRCSLGVFSLPMMSETSCCTDVAAVLGYHRTGDANDLTTFRFMSLRDTSDCTPSRNFSSCLSGQYYYAPHFDFSKASTENGNLENGNFCQKKASDFVDEKTGFDAWLEHRENYLVGSNRVCSYTNIHEGVSSSNSAISSPDAYTSDSLSVDFRESDFDGIAGETEALNPLSDLSGDYDSHIRSLLYGQCCHEYALCAPVLPNPPTSSVQIQNKKSWDRGHGSMLLKPNSCSQMNTNGVVAGPPIYPANNSSPSSASFGMEERHKARGTGTYFPNMNGSCPERPPQGRGGKHGPGTHNQSQRHTCNNGLATVLPETISLEAGHELLHPRSPVQVWGKTGLSCQSNTHANGFSHSSQRLEFGSLGHLPEGRTEHSWGLTPSIVPALEVQGSKPVSGRKQERFPEQSFRLKNEDDFPPLSV